jgi:hypothetical protein
MTQVFYCNFNRVLEKKEELDDENTIHYFKANRVLINIMVVIEIVYCLLCMVLFLLIIYWNAKQKTHVIFGKEDEPDNVQSTNEAEDFMQTSENNKFSRRLNNDIKRSRESENML